MPGAETPFAKLVEETFGNVQEIVRSEVKLAKAEAREEAVKAARAGAVLGGGIVIALFAIGFLLWSAVYGLSTVWPTWLAALAIGGFLLIVAVGAIVAGRARMRQLHLPPARTVENVKENLEWARHR